MKKSIVSTIIGVIMLGCNPTPIAKEKCCPEIDSVTSFSSPIEDSSILIISKVLVKSANTEKSIKKIVVSNSNLNKENETLQKVNTGLNSELKVVKDSLVEVQIQLKETLSKIPKKRNFFQKIVGAAEDSIEVKHIDTIKN
jgi:hypothetical protein